nr:unnamed protein product [Digitaria exilis]
MLNLPSWENLNLTVNFFSSKNTKFTAGCPALPSQMKTVVCAMEDLQCSTEGPSSEDDDLSQEEPQDQQELSDSPTRDEQSELSWQRPSSDEDDHSERQRLSSVEAQPMGGLTGIAGSDVGEDSTDVFAPIKWSEILDTRTELDEPTTSPRYSWSLSGDDCGTAMEGGLGELSPMLTFGAGSDDADGGHILNGSDVIDLVTPIPVGRLRRRGCVNSICSKIVDLTSSPVVIQL